MGYIRRPHLSYLGSVCTAVEITPSELAPKREDRREKAFEDWVSIDESGLRFNELNHEGKFPIYSERKDGKVRDLFIDKPDGLVYWTWGPLNKESLLGKHRQYTREGFVLVSLVDNYAGGYWATWVNEDESRTVLSQLRRFGISQGSIELKHIGTQ